MHCKVLWDLILCGRRLHSVGEEVKDIRLRANWSPLCNCALWCAHCAPLWIVQLSSGKSGFDAFCSTYWELLRYSLLLQLLFYPFLALSNFLGHMFAMVWHLWIKYSFFLISSTTHGTVHWLTVHRSEGRWEAWSKSKATHHKSGIWSSSPFQKIIWQLPPFQTITWQIS